MNAQEIFTRVYNHFIVENNPYSFDEECEACCYRKGTNACAVGLFIPDEVYSINLEGLVFSSLVTNHLMPSEIHSLFVENYKLFSALQSLHDSCALNSRPKAQFAEMLRDLAKECGLEIPS